MAALNWESKGKIVMKLTPRPSSCEEKARSGSVTRADPCFVLSVKGTFEGAECTEASQISFGMS